MWTTDGRLVFVVAATFEQITAGVPEFFNSNHAASGFDGRSDDKGPEPEDLARRRDRGHAVRVRRRWSGSAAVMVYDVTDPRSRVFVTYLNNRDFASPAQTSSTPVSDIAPAGDLGPEGLEFIPAVSSPTGQPMLAAANEVSGSTTLYAVQSKRR